MSMTAEQVKSAGKFVNNAKQLLANARNKNHTACFYDKLMKAEKKAICTLANTNSRVELTAQHINMKFEDMSIAERRAIYRGIKALQKISLTIPMLMHLGDCD